MPQVETAEDKKIRKIIRENDEKMIKQVEESKSKVIARSSIIPAGKKQQFEGGIDIATVPMPEPTNTFEVQHVPMASSVPQ